MSNYCRRVFLYAKEYIYYSRKNRYYKPYYIVNINQLSIIVKTKIRDICSIHSVLLL